MPDMRATERLLKVIEERAEGILGMPGNDPEGIYAMDDADVIAKAVTELRRRGDTLVQADDLRMALDIAEPIEPSEQAAVDRLENALHGDTFPTGRENT